MKKFGEEITEEIKKLRESLGLKCDDDFVLPTRDVEIKADKIPELLHPSGILVHNGIPVFVYIRDHSVGKLETDGPDKLNKIHLSSKCPTLKEMLSKGAIKRYQTTSRVDNLYPVEFKGRKEAFRKLHPCKNCLHALSYQGYSKWNKWLPRYSKIVNDFDAKDARKILGNHLNNFAKEHKLRIDDEVSGYPPDWDNISEKYRRSVGFICEKKNGVGCGVNLSHSKKLADCHHINHVKSHCHRDNLQCICKECHARLHPHYNPAEEKFADIRRIRKEQGIPNP